MSQFYTFFKKEYTEFWRNGKIGQLCLVALIFGIMSPAMAKLTPLIMEMAAESLEGSGLMITDVEINALTSWTQYYKNIPLVVFVFLVLFSSIMTMEYQKGTLINMLTKGMARYKIVLAKTTIMVLTWTVGYFLCFGITYGYNEFLWGNDIAKNVFFAAFCIYTLGVWLISILMLASVFFENNTTVGLITALAFGVCYALSMIPAIKKFLPAYLVGSQELLMGSENIEQYMIALVITLIFSAINILVAVIAFDKKSFL